ncbi:DUF421 domain-containing protein [Alteribacter aurantiacus]|uniref:DUF421 domain-containing protein n=1 Tax=Alteribacter aurantiacus TaxID=254410 RepID=UPI001FDFBBBE|nr:DUF421 domain-containing protein [Alteribacter aurantiacus]
MDIGTIAARTIVIYFVILLVMRMMGKREIGQLSIVDFVVSIMIAELAVVSIENTTVPMIEQVTPMVILMLIQISLAFVSLKSDRMRKIIDGKPSVLINRGEIDEKEMRKQRYNFDDLLIQLRQKNVQSPADVEFAILEPSGKLSVIKKKKGKEKKDILLPLPIILDGKVQNKHLEQMGKTPLWLRQELRKLGYKDIKKISYCIYTDEGNFFIDEKG